MTIRIIQEPISLADAQELAKEIYGDMVKGVADIERGIIALGGEYHMDANNLLIEEGSKQPNLWGFNVYVDREGDEWIECHSLINIRPAAGNRGPLISDPALEKRVREVVEGLILRG